MDNKNKIFKYIIITVIVIVIIIISYFVANLMVNKESKINDNSKQEENIDNSNSNSNIISNSNEVIKSNSNSNVKSNSNNNTKTSNSSSKKKITLPIKLDSSYYNTQKNKVFDSLNKKIENLTSEQLSIDWNNDEKAKEKEAYYTKKLNEQYVEKAKVINNLVKNKASFIVAFDNTETYCSGGKAFGDPYVYAESFAVNNNIFIYKANIIALKNTTLYKKVKHTPNVVIVYKGEILSYIDHNSNKFKKIYSDEKEFNKWLKSYVKVK